ncbi:MAG TPA: metallophosphoesterase, partial [Arachidicoccus sp.]|nr:metallophosphoesterase [Arachidicoccus sp.]
MYRFLHVRIILILLIIIIDTYLFFVLRFLTQNYGSRTKMVVFSIHWGISILSIISLFFIGSMEEQVRRYVITILVGVLVAKLLTLVILLLDETRRGLFWTVRRIAPAKSELAREAEVKIPRSTFLVWLGMILGGGFLGVFMYGMTNKYNYRVRKVRLRFPNLPDAFKGLKIAQLSDIHSGSFSNKPAVSKGVDMVLNEKPDLILFTGDLVNDRATEMENYHDLFSKIKAPMGVYSTLGNHDYGDYVEWDSEQEKAANLEDLKQIQAKMGWKLLMNEHVIFERDGQKIALIGIENWGAKARFPKYGKLDVAYKGTETIPFKILMSHDPSHWDAQVRPEYGAIDLTLAGHTHGMQFGVELPHFKWSPIQYMYKQWAGLYQEGKQYLYVNR